MIDHWTIIFQRKNINLLFTMKHGKGAMSIRLKCLPVLWPLLVTRLHSSRMRTARTLTVSPSMLWSGGCTWSRGVYLVPGGVPGWGVYLVWGGVPDLGGFCSRGCTWSKGGSALGGDLVLWGVSALGSVPGPGGVSAQGGVPGPGGCTWSQGVSAPGGCT